MSWELIVAFVFLAIIIWAAYQETKNAGATDRTKTSRALRSPRAARTRAYRQTPTKEARWLRNAAGHAGIVETPAMADWLKVPSDVIASLNDPKVKTPRDVMRYLEEQGMTDTLLYRRLQADPDFEEKERRLEY